MEEVRIERHILDAAAQQGGAAVVEQVARATTDAVGGTLTAEALQRLNGEQATLIAYDALRREVMEGGIIQLIYNGWGDFIFRNPFARVMRSWGLVELAKLCTKAGKLNMRYAEDIAAAQTDEEFMALYERMPEFDDCDDDFVEQEDAWTRQVAAYVMEHADRFSK